MIRIVQAGESGKTKYLFDMHRFRTKIFKERLNWDVKINRPGLEVDDFDVPDAVYFLACDQDDRVVGTWRIIPTTIPYMINTVWPEFLNSISLPSGPYIWEASRFAVDSPPNPSEEEFSAISRVTKELFHALTQTCILCGIDEIYTMYDLNIGRLVRRLNCTPYKKSERLTVAGRKCEVGAFRTDKTMLANIRAACPFEPQDLTLDDLPPVLLDLYESRQLNTMVG